MQHRTAPYWNRTAPQPDEHVYLLLHFSPDSLHSFIEDTSAVWLKSIQYASPTALALVPWAERTATGRALANPHNGHEAATHRVIRSNNALRTIQIPQLKLSHYNSQDDGQLHVRKLLANAPMPARAEG